jgi:hypothetical protein
MQTSDGRSTLAAASLAAAVLLVVLCGIVLATGVSQQWFEWTRPPDVYAAALVRDAYWLRVEIGIDDVFITAYVATGVLFVAGIVRDASSDGARALAVISGIAVVLAGALDLSENHHILGLIDLASAGVEIPVSEIIERSHWSELKWMLGHVGFAFAGLAIASTDRLTRAFRLSLVAWQLPIGAATWVVTSASLLPVLVWARYVGLISGFAMIAWLARSSKSSPARLRSRSAAPGAPPMPAAASPNGEAAIDARA